ncbi:putative bacterial ABC-type protein transporter [Dioscorea sansibarensis]
MHSDTSRRTQVFIRVLPIWASTIALSISFAQLSTFFITQSTTMDRKLGNHFLIPPGSVAVFAALNGLLLVPLYESIVVPFLRRIAGPPPWNHFTPTYRCWPFHLHLLPWPSAAIIESKRRHNQNSLKMTVFWLLPQFFLMGSAEVFTYVGQLEFFYDEATDGTRSLSSAMFLSEIGIGSWLSTALVKIIERVTGGMEEGWLRNNLNESRLDKFYWVLCAINAVNFVVYVFVAMAYGGREESHAKVVDEGSVCTWG